MGSVEQNYNTPSPFVQIPEGATPDERLAFLKKEWNKRPRAHANWKSCTENGDGWRRFLNHHSFYHFYYNEWYHPLKRHELNPRLHWDMCTFWEPAMVHLSMRAAGMEIPKEMLDRKIRFMFCPRGTRKSSIQWAFAVWVLLHDPTCRILYMNSTVRNGYKTLKVIKRFFRNSECVENIYPEYKVDPKIIRTKDLRWGNEGLELPVAVGFLSQEANFEVAGVETTETGMHFDLYLPDDIVDRSNFNTEAGRASVKSKLMEMFNVLDPTAPWAGVGTPWHRDDAYAWLQNKDIQANEEEIDSDNDLIVPHIFHRKAIENRYGYEDEPVYPEKLDRSQLNKLRRKLGSHFFNCQYMCEPLNPQKAIFNAATFRYYKLENIPPSMNIYVLFDDASKTSKKHSQKAIIVVGVDGERNVYILQVFCGHYQRSRVLELFKMLYEYYSTWAHTNQLWFYAEAINAFDTLRREITEKIQQEYPGFALLEVPFNTRTDHKIARIMSLEPLASDNKLFFRLKDKAHTLDIDPGDPDTCYNNLHDEHMQQLWRRMRDITLDDHDAQIDDVDTLAYVMRIMNPPKVRTSQGLEERPGGTRSLDVATQERLYRTKRHEIWESFRKYVAENPTALVEHLAAEYKDRYMPVGEEEIAMEGWMD